MKNEGIQKVAQYDTPGMYATSAALRQMKDAEWAIGLLPDRQFHGCLDIGCGTGDFLGQLGLSGKVSELLMGIDRSENMVKTARKNLRPMAGQLKLKLRQADILQMPKLEDRFELVTLMAVLHWLHPNEAEVFSWISNRLTRYGVFCLTTYHPAVNGKYVGGTDEVVLEAMEQVGGPAGFPAGFVTIGQRARGAEEVEHLLRGSFRVYEVHARPAITRATSARQYADFHAATFGSYYSQLVQPKRRAQFLEEVGNAAMRRMKTLGYVTNMQVRFWVCGQGPSAKHAAGWPSLQLLKSA